MVSIEMSHLFPVHVTEGFEYITSLNNWEHYWPDFVRIKDIASAQWGKSGDNVTLVLRLLNRERELNMKLEDYKPDFLVTYISRQQGLPDAHHERHFHAAPGGFEYRLVVTYEPRPGPTGLFDRSLVRRAVTRAVHKTIQNLDIIFKQRQTIA
jgi:hypothetical protein